MAKRAEAGVDSAVKSGGKDSPVMAATNNEKALRRERIEEKGGDGQSHEST